MAEREDESLPGRLKRFVSKAGDALLHSPAGPIVVGGIMGAMSGTAIAAPFGAELVEGPTKTADGLSWFGKVRVYTALTELTQIRVPVPGTIPPQWFEWSLPADFRTTIPANDILEADAGKILVRQARAKALLAAGGVGALIGIVAGTASSLGGLSKLSAP